MRHLLLIFLCTLFLINSAIADERKTLFEGFRMKMVSGVDTMTDEEWGVIFVHFGFIHPFYIAIYGHDDFRIWGDENEHHSLHFAPDGDHLIRVGKNKPFPLEYVSRRTGLRPLNKVDAQIVIKSLVKGEKLKLRFYTWPSYEKIDKELQKRNLAFLYKRAVNQFGWKDFGIPGDLAPVNLDIHIPEDPDSKGYARLYVKENSHLQLQKRWDEYGGGCWIEVGINKLFGMKNSKWCTANTHRSKIIIRDSEGKITFEGEIPEGLLDTPWPLAKKAADAAWEGAPLGNIEVEGEYPKKALLYGFKELWKWGIENAGLSSLE